MVCRWLAIAIDVRVLAAQWRLFSEGSLLANAREKQRNKRRTREVKYVCDLCELTGLVDGEHDSAAESELSLATQAASQQLC